MKKSDLLICSIILLLGEALGAEGNTKKIDFKSDRIIVNPSENKKHVLYSGNAVLKTDTTTIKADEIESYGNDFQYTLCRGNVRVEDSDRQIYLTCENLFYDRELEIIRVNGYCEMEDRKNNIVTKSGYLEDRRDESITTFSIWVRIATEDMICRSEFALYDQDANTLELTGMPKVTRESEEFIADKIFVDLDTEEISLEGNVSGNIKSKE